MKKTLLTAAVTAGAVWAVRHAKKSSQSWFWTEEWQDGEREATSDIELGRTMVVSPEEMFSGLSSKTEA